MRKCTIQQMKIGIAGRWAPSEGGIAGVALAAFSVRQLGSSPCCAWCRRFRRPEGPTMGFQAVLRALRLLNKTFPNIPRCCKVLGVKIEHVALEPDAWISLKYHSLARKKGAVQLAARRTQSLPHAKLTLAQRRDGILVGHQACDAVAPGLGAFLGLI